MPTQKSPRTQSKLPERLKGAAIVRTKPAHIPQHLRSLVIGPNDLQHGALRFLYNKLFHELDMLSPAERLTMLQEMLRHATPAEIEAYAGLIADRLPPAKPSPQAAQRKATRKGALRPRPGGGWASDLGVSEDW